MPGNGRSMAGYRRRIRIVSHVMYAHGSDKVMMSVAASGSDPDAASANKGLVAWVVRKAGTTLTYLPRC